MFVNVLRLLCKNEEESRADEDRDALDERLPDPLFATEFKEDIRHRNLEKASGGYGQKDMLDAIHAALNQEYAESTDHCGQGRKEVQHQCPLPPISAMEEHREVADFLRNLMEDHCKRCHDAEVDIRKICTGDEDAVESIVDTVADQNHAAYRMNASASGSVAEMPKDGSLYEK